MGRHIVLGMAHCLTGKEYVTFYAYLEYFHLSFSPSIIPNKTEATFWVLYIVGFFDSFVYRNLYNE